mmetsp:Transcript_4524/g.6806  ORF Transcript_4524/g.6806 Transcript_4524/m.6806 type:complete len:312 (-) Transcript_4524:140-1075(-)
MKAILSIALAATAILSPCTAFTIPSRTTIRPDVSHHMKQQQHDSHDDDHAHHHHHLELTRRSAVSILTALPLASVLASSSINPLPAMAENKGKIVVLGGAGWVGAHVSNLLTQRGYTVVSISRSSSETQIERTKSILGTTIPSVEYVSLDAGSATIEELGGVMKDATCVISCVGIAPGSPNVKDGNGLVNSRIANAAKSVGVGKFVYVGVASSLANGPAKFLLGDYFKGKDTAEKSITKEFGIENSLIIKPAIVAGGTPGEIRPPGPPGVKAVDVDALAKVVVAGATTTLGVGGLNGSIDGNDAIVAASLL